MSHFRIYKVEVSRHVRKDGRRLVKDYGCDGSRHAIFYCRISCDSKGNNVTGGTAGFRPTKIVGPCTHKECKNLGGFIAD